MSLEPAVNCRRCPRLVTYRNEQRKTFPDWHNSPVASIGSLEAELLVLGLAPGLKGANKTGIPFSGDGSGDLLFENLVSHQFATGIYKDSSAASLTLHNCRISNAVRCVPPENKPTGTETRNCLPFLRKEIAAMRNIKVILCLGSVAHAKALQAFNLSQKHAKFGHLQRAQLNEHIWVFDSYHCSRYNLNTGRLTKAMFLEVFQAIVCHLKENQ